MTPQRFAQYVRYKTRSNSTTFTDPDILMLMNVHKDEIATEIIKADEDYFGAPETTDLQVGVREYPLPSDMLNHVKYVEAKLDGTNWIPLGSMDLNDYGSTTDEAKIISIYANEENRAFFDVFRNSLFIYSGTITDVTGGLKIWSYQFPADITDLASTTDMSIDPTTTSAGFPRAFHELLARRVIIDKKGNADKPIPLDANELKYDVDLQDKIDSIVGLDKNYPMTASVPSGNKTWNNGMDL